MNFRNGLAALVLWAGASAQAAGISPDPTGFWYLPEESGWGASVAQQDDILFVALFVQDEQRRPTWFVAPRVTDSGTHLDPIGAEVFTGALYRVSAPWFGGTFDPNAVGVETVGTLEVAYLPFSDDPRLSINYTVNGVRVSKALKPQTWGSNHKQLAGKYDGMFTILSGSAQNACIVDLGRFFPSSLARLEILAVTASVFSIGWLAGPEGCVMEGSYEQHGQTGSVHGRLMCGISPLPRIEVASFALNDVTVSAGGFSANVNFSAGGCMYSGRIGGVRRPG